MIQLRKRQQKSGETIVWTNTKEIIIWGLADVFTTLDCVKGIQSCYNVTRIRDLQTVFEIVKHFRSSSVWTGFWKGELDKWGSSGFYVYYSLLPV